MRQAVRQITITHARKLTINDDLQTLSQVFYLLSADPATQHPKLKAFLQLGQAAVRRLAETIATSDSHHADAHAESLTATLGSSRQ